MVTPAALLLAGRADLWDDRWEMESRQRTTGQTPKSDTFFSHPEWAKGLPDVDRRSMVGMLRLMGIAGGTGGTPKVRARDINPAPCLKSKTW